MNFRALMAALAFGALACTARTAARSPAPTAAIDAGASSGGPASSRGSGALPPSCTPGGPGRSDCGVAHEDCCTSPEVLGGTFFAIYGPHYAPDGGWGSTEPSDPMTVSTFRLDKYDVTVGRFRPFVQAWRAGYRPAIGAGKHAHLNGGRGLVTVNDEGFEPGWIGADEGNVALTSESLACREAATWTASPGGRETQPINCVNWWESYAFCIWDGGFLPSDAEWGYAAAGGSEQRRYPWGAAEPGADSEYAFYNCHYPLGPAANCNVVKAVDFTPANIAPVGLLPRGAGRWGQLDLEGNMAQRTIDSLTDGGPCVDCGYRRREFRGIHGADFGSFPEDELKAWNYSPVHMTVREDFIGVRCARSP